MKIRATFVQASHQATTLHIARPGQAATFCGRDALLYSPSRIVPRGHLCEVCEVGAVKVGRLQDDVLVIDAPSDQVGRSSRVIYGLTALALSRTDEEREAVASVLESLRTPAGSGTAILRGMDADRLDVPPLPPEIPEALGEKVHDLIEGKRVLVSATFKGPGVGDLWTPYVYAYVIGDHEPYIVRADNDAVRCSCWAARMGQDCAHRYAAMAVWQELDGGR